MSNVTVEIEFVKKMMEEKKRCIYFLEDSTGNILAYQDDPAMKVADACTKLDEDLTYINGNFVWIRIHAKAPGGGNKPGGKQEPIFRYRINLGQPQQGRGQQNIPGGNMGLGQLGLFEKFFSQISDLKSEISQAKHATEIAKKDAEIEKLKAQSKDAPMNVLAMKMLNHWAAMENVKETVKTGKKFAAPIADESKQHRADTKEVLEALKDLHSIDPEYMKNLRLFAAYAKANPEQYEAFIKSFQE